MPLEIERKFLVRETRQAPSDLVIDTRYIVQTYLVPNIEESTERVRLSTDGYVPVYTHTVKIRVDHGVHEEEEREIPAEEYGQLLSRADPSLNVISKTRYTFDWGDWTWELDSFSGLKDERGQKLQVLEVEIDDPQTQVEVPPFIIVEREVTDDRNYTNRSLAERSRT